MTFLGKSVMAN